MNPRPQPQRPSGRVVVSAQVERDLPAEILQALAAVRRCNASALAVQHVRPPLGVPRRAWRSRLLAALDDLADRGLVDQLQLATRGVEYRLRATA